MNEEKSRWPGPVLQILLPYSGCISQVGGRVCGASYHAAFPRQQKEHTAIAGARLQEAHVTVERERAEATDWAVDKSTTKGSSDDLRRAEDVRWSKVAGQYHVDALAGHHNASLGRLVHV